jgi:excisionase family DNA binding protein
MVEELHTVKEVATILKVSERAILDWLRSGRLRGSKAGKAWRIRQSDLEAFLGDAGEGEGRQHTPEEHN